MSDDERIEQLLQSILNAVNGSQLPLGAKILALENILLKAQATLRQQKNAPPQPAEKEVPQE